MKKTLILLFVAALGAGTMSSCKKSNKGKLSGEWKIASFDMTSSNTSGDPAVTTTDVTTSTDGAAVTQVSSSTATGSTTTTTNGTIATATWTIEKDGTWTMVMDMTWSGSETGYTWSSQSVETTTGTWAFVGKNKTEDLKRNERVIFNTLTSASSSTDTFTPTGGTASTSTSSDSNSWLTGENQATYLITESKKKSLIMTQAGTSTWSDTSGDPAVTVTGGSTSAATMTLSQD